MRGQQHIKKKWYSSFRCLVAKDAEGNEHSPETLMNTWRCEVWSRCTWWIFG